MLLVLVTIIVIRSNAITQILHKTIKFAVPMQAMGASYHGYLHAGQRDHIWRENNYSWN